MGLDKLRKQIDQIDEEILELLNARMELVKDIGELKTISGQEIYLPKREQEILENLTKKSTEVLKPEMINNIFTEIINQSKELQVQKSSMKIKDIEVDFEINGVKINSDEQFIIAGPCAIESEEQLSQVARSLKNKGVKFIRAGAYKPRTSPYDFQGLEKQGLKILEKVAREYGLISVSEITSVENIELFNEHVDIIQIGARNMQNFELLKKLGSNNKPVILKRGFANTIDEWLCSAEYLVNSGNKNIIMCERGIRTFESQTRNTLDISSIAIIKQLTRIPVIGDVSHSAGRRDIIIPLAKATMACGANGVMLEVHPTPREALSDSNQQLTIEEFSKFMEEL